MKRLMATVTLLAAATSAQAAVINHSDVNGFRTFQDTNTGYIWADLDNWIDPAGAPNAGVRYATYATYLAALQTAGFTWADWTTVDNMLQTVPLQPNATPTRQAISTDWLNTVEYVGGYSDLGGGTFTVHEIRFGAAGAYWADFTPPGGNPVNVGNGRGLWAYMASAPGGGGGPGAVPEPGSLALAAIALVALAQRRSRGAAH
jgi:hypothetical protein